MIEEVSVSGPPKLTVPGQRPVERVAKPIHNQTEARQEKEFAAPVAPDVAQAADHRAGYSNGCQVIRRDPTRQVAAETMEN